MKKCLWLFILYHYDTLISKGSINYLNARVLIFFQERKSSYNFNSETTKILLHAINISSLLQILLFHIHAELQLQV